jgi:hypothetical protein
LTDLILQPGRLYDYSVKNSGQKQVYALSLPSPMKLANKKISLQASLTHQSFPMILSSLSQGMEAWIKVLLNAVVATTIENVSFVRR